MSPRSATFSDLCVCGHPMDVHGSEHLGLCEWCACPVFVPDRPALIPPAKVPPVVVAGTDFGTVPDLIRSEAPTGPIRVDSPALRAVRVALDALDRAAEGLADEAVDPTMFASCKLTLDYAAASLLWAATQGRTIR